MSYSLYYVLGSFQNGEWTGLIKEMILKRADMVITSIKINHQRSTAMDFSTPFLETGITIMVALRKGAISATAFLGNTTLLKNCFKNNLDNVEHRLDTGELVLGAKCLLNVKQ